MRAFISNTIGDDEDLLVSYAASKLREQGISTTGSIYGKDSSYQLKNTDYFLGIVTNDGNYSNQVFQEWEIANQRNIPYLMLIEKGNSLLNQLPENEDILILDSDNPQKTQLEIQQNIAIAKKKAIDEPTEFFRKYWLRIAGGSTLLDVISVFITLEKQKQLA